MGKSCLNKLRGNITVGCTVPQVGVKNLYLMHAGDVTPTVDANTTLVVSAAFASGAVAILVEGYKQNIQITSAIRTMDASSKLDFTVMFKLAGRDTATILRVRSLLNGKFYVLAEYQDGSYSFIGYISPLECSGMDTDSNANAGFTTVTLTAPEGSSGNYLMRASVDAIATIKSKIGV
ncbi:hypothetical protein BX788P2_00006 [Bacteroides phage BX788P2]|nr:hypothetical protein BX788P2_00006 [Bacteroides phage BX788P2]